LVGGTHNGQRLNDFVVFNQIVNLAANAAEWACGANFSNFVHFKLGFAFNG
jgi:hypothetical protein